MRKLRNINAYIRSERASASYAQRVHKKINSVACAQENCIVRFSCARDARTMTH